MKNPGPVMDPGSVNDLDGLIARILAGNSDLYRGVVETYEGNIRAVISAMIPDPNQVPDVTQEVFLIAYQRLSTYRAGSNFSAWLRTIARNVAQNERRRWYRQRKQEEQFKAEVVRTVEPHVDTVLGEIPEDLLGALDECVTRLNGKSKEVTDGFYFRDRTLGDLAGRLGISMASAKVILHRARQAIGSCLQKKGQCHV